MKTLDTLVADIHKLLEEGADVPEALIQEFSGQLSRLIRDRLRPGFDPPVLRMSLLGTECHRKLWYTLNHPELAEKLDGKTKLKFLYGDLVESLVLFLAEVSGHDVRGKQSELTIDGVPGHRDAIIDGVLVDIKSASPFGFKKFRSHGLMGDDPFGYLDQINSYLFASQDDPDLVDKERAAFIAVEKVMGDLCVDIYPSNKVDYSERVAELRKMLVQPKPPARAFEDVPDGKSGNRALGLQCSYCAFKQECWPGLKVFPTSRGPKFLTHIEKPPRLEEGSF